MPRGVSQVAMVHRSFCSLPPHRYYPPSAISGQIPSKRQSPSSLLGQDSRAKNGGAKTEIILKRMRTQGASIVVLAVIIKQDLTVIHRPLAAHKVEACRHKSTIAASFSRWHAAICLGFALLPYFDLSWPDMLPIETVGHGAMKVY